MIGLPRHQLVLRNQPLLVEAELHVDGRLVAETSFAPRTSRRDPSVLKFIRGYFHLPEPKKAT